ncbi:MAG: hypothetical protein R2853_06030 [Thermomicrobiales bacterium]
MRQRLSEGKQRVIRRAGLQPGGVRGRGDAQSGGGWRWYPPAIARLPGRLGVARGPVGRQERHGGVARPGHEGVEVDERADARREGGGDARDHHTAVAVADQDDLAQITCFQHGADICNVRLEPRGPGEFPGAFREAGQGRCDHLVPCRS